MYEIILNKLEQLDQLAESELPIQNLGRPM